MEKKKLGAVEARFADLIWDNAPINSTALVRLCAQELDWKKSTTYTVLKKLCDRGIFQNVNGLWRRPSPGPFRLSWRPLPPARPSRRRKWTRSRS